jgi:pimeloyl-ACP methyl ester carboxylesterase
VADTSYAPCGDLSLAYQVFGDGPVELVFVGSFVSRVELGWTLPEFKAFFEQLSTFCRVVLFDKAGVGLSDPVPQVRTLDDRAAEIEAVMDAVGFRKAALFGLAEGGHRQDRQTPNTATIIYATFRRGWPWTRPLSEGLRCNGMTLVALGFGAANAPSAAM